MDFKVVGTTTGITTLQMDIKIKGLTREIVKASLEQACEGRLHILKIMGDTLEQSRAKTFQLCCLHHPQDSTDKISIVIGPGGKMIKSIVERTGVKVNISDDGLVSIASGDHKAVDAALGVMRSDALWKSALFMTGLSSGWLTWSMIFPGTEGLVHISNLAEGRVRAVTDVVREGDTVKVKAMGLDKQGKLRLSIKDV